MNNRHTQLRSTLRHNTRRHTINGPSQFWLALRLVHRSIGRSGHDNIRLGCGKSRYAAGRIGQIKFGAADRHDLDAMTSAPFNQRAYQLPGAPGHGHPH